jgi:dTDP-4-dehydrorhamnose 3,5-epimerase
LIEPELKVDERGFFTRTWCKDEFAGHGIDAGWVQCNISFNRRRGTLRGLHYQAAPYGEAKLIRCTRGAIFDVIIDLRADSPQRGKWFGTELTAESRCSVYVPEGFAHGFQTLVDDTEVFYQMSQSYHPEAARGLRWDDATVNIRWPVCFERIISPADRNYPDFTTCELYWSPVPAAL